jgi:hypothetical protein
MHLITRCGIELKPQLIKLVIASLPEKVWLNLVINNRPVSLRLDDSSTDSGQ